MEDQRQKEGTLVVLIIFIISYFLFQLSLYSFYIVVFTLPLLFITLFSVPIRPE